METKVDCGPRIVEFFFSDNDSGDTALLGTELFFDDRRDLKRFNLALQKTDDTSKIGFYQIKLRAYLVLYDQSLTEEEAFTVEIGCCRCDDAKNLITLPLPSVFEDMIYVIGNLPISQSFNIKSHLV